ncbi:hypothetical protein IG631_00131 [Alternaria alternata]|nr:hypothetical protein IG631_00131 [Alternaria alternata]
MANGELGKRTNFQCPMVVCAGFPCALLYIQKLDVKKNVKILAFDSNRRHRDASLCLDKENGADGDKIKNQNPKLHSVLLNLRNHAVQPALQALRLLRHDPKPKPLPRVVVVPKPTSPRHTLLAFAPDVEAIVTHTMFWTFTVCLEQPTKKGVLYALTSCTIAHLACHGIVDENNLLQNGLIIAQEADENLSVADVESVTCERSRIA